VENAEQPEVAADISPISPAADWIPQSSIKIGLLAPLTGVSSQEGNDLLRGVSAALTNYSVINGKPVELVVEDTESDLIQSVLKTRNLIDKGVIAIIGPVYGESTITSALESNAHGIPFIAPTAPDVGIPSLGEYVFQINNTPIMQAEELARFSSDSLGFTNAVIISSNDWWGKAVTETFTAEFEQRGGKILCTEEFEQGVNRYNYNDILMRIRSTAPESDAIPDSMMVFDYGNAFPDTVIVKPDPKTTPQRLKPVTSIDCILVSALPEEAVNIVRQIRDYHIDAVILGDSGWSDESVAAELGHYGEGAYLVMTSTESGGAAGSQYFSDNFRARNAELHTITSRKGYDACAILIHCLAQGAADPLSLKQRLENVRDFGGLTSRYTIDPERRINTALDFVQIQNGRLVRIQRIGMQDDDGISPEQRL